MSDLRIAGYRLLEQVAGLEIGVLEQHTEPTAVDDVFMRIQFRIDRDDVSISAFGLVFAVGVLSFHDARPRGVSGKWFEEGDEWTVGDMLEHLRFERGELRMYTDYVRGRMMKTTVVIRGDGTCTLETVNRGERASRWLTHLQGKKVIAAVDRPS